MSSEFSSTSIISSLQQNSEWFDILVYRLTHIVLEYLDGPRKTWWYCVKNDMESFGLSAWT